jgi:hypothetical protein
MLDACVLRFLHLLEVHPGPRFGPVLVPPPVQPCFWRSWLVCGPQSRGPGWEEVRLEGADHLLRACDAIWQVSWLDIRKIFETRVLGILVVSIVQGSNLVGSKHRVQDK